MELLGMVMHALPADTIQNPVFRLVPLKGARAVGEGRLVMLAPATARALAMYLRARRHHPLADTDWVWLGTRGRGKLQGTGIRRILIRRAEQAGYAGVTPHQFRHTFSDAWLKSGGSEGDLMRLNGWKSRAMVDRYADDVAKQRALEAENDEYAAFACRVLRAWARRVAAGDIDAITDMAAAVGELEDAIRQSVAGLRGKGYSWAEIAARLGVTRQAAQQRWGGSGRDLTVAAARAPGWLPP
jgi:Phage integrase family